MANDPQNPTIQDILNLANVSPTPASPTSDLGPSPSLAPSGAAYAQSVAPKPTLGTTEELQAPAANAPASDSLSSDNSTAPSSVTLPAPNKDNTSGAEEGEQPNFLHKLGQFAAGAMGVPALSDPHASPESKASSIMSLLGKIGTVGSAAFGSPQQKEQAIQRQGQQNQLLALQNEAAYRQGMLGNAQNKMGLQYGTGESGQPLGTSRESANASAERASTGATLAGAKVPNLQASTENLQSETAKRNYELETMKNGQFPVDFATAQAVGRPDLAGKPVSEQLWKGFQSVLNARGYKTADLGMAPGGHPEEGGLWLLDREGNKVHQISEVSPSAARGQAYGSFRPVQAIDANGNAVYMTAGKAEATGAAPAGLGAQVMSKQAQFSDIYSGLGQMRSAVNGIANQPIDANTIATLTAATRETDPTIAHTLFDTIAGSQRLTPQQQDFVVSLGQLNERVLSLRNLAGMGNASDSMRAAIRATLPAIKDGNVELMRKKLDAVTNLVDNLHTGVPNISAVPKTGTPVPKASTPQNAPAEGQTATGPGGHKIQFTGGKWVDAATKQPI